MPAAVLSGAKKDTQASPAAEHRGPAVSDTKNNGGATLGAWLLDTQDEELTKFSQTVARSSPTLHRLDRLVEQGRVKNDNVHFIKTAHAQAAIAFVITASSVLTGIDVQMIVSGADVSKHAEVIMIIFQFFFIIIFIVELALYIYADGLKFLSPRNPAGLVDAMIIAGAFVELIVRVAGEDTGVVRVTVVLRVFRLLQWLSALKVLHVVKEIRMLFVGFPMSCAPVLWSAVFMMIAIYIGAIFCAIVLSDVHGPPDIGEYFGSVAMCLFSHFQLMTLEDWPDISDSVMQASGNGLFAAYFIAFIVVTSLALLNLVTGIVCEKMVQTHAEEDTDTDQLAAYTKDVEDFRAQLESVFLKTDLNRYGTINSQEFSRLLALPEMKHLLESNGVFLELTEVELFDIIDADSSGNLSFNELVDALLRLRGSHNVFHSLIVQHEVATLRRTQVQHVEALEHTLEECISQNIVQTGSQLASGLEDVDAKARRLTSVLHAEGRDVPSRSDCDFGDNALTANLVQRFEALIEDLDQQCACANKLLSGASSHWDTASRATCVSQGAQTDATIDFIEGLAPHSSERAMLQL